MKRSGGFCGLGRDIFVITIAALVCAPPAWADDFVLGYDPSSTETYTLSGGTLSATRGTIGYWGTGIFDQSGGTASFPDQLILGHETSGTGVYTLSGGSLVAGSGTVGLRGVGEFTQSGGRAWVTDLILAHDAGATGRYVLENGLLLGAERLCVGYEGTGSFVQTGGGIGFAHLPPDFLFAGLEVVLGYGSGGTGTYLMSGGSLAATSGTIGYQGSGFFKQTRGTATFTDELILGYESGGTGRYQLGTEALPATAWALSVTRGTVGYRGVGEFTQSGGQALFDDFLVLGREAGGTGCYLLEGGQLSAIHGVCVGDEGSGTFTQTGGKITRHYLALQGLQMTLGAQAGGFGQYVLEGGTLDGLLIVGAGGSGHVVQTGGTVTEAIVNRGVYELHGGSTRASTIYGTFIQTGGTNLAPSPRGLNLGGSVSSRYELHGGFLGGGAGTIGGPGEAEFIQTGGSCIFVSPYGYLPGLVLGKRAGTSGTYRLSGGSLAASSPGPAESGCVVGQGGTGLFVQTGGEATFTRVLELARDPSGRGRYELSGGTLSANLGYIGGGGLGELVQSGGQAAFQGDLFVGEQSGSTGIYELAGGTLWARGGTVGHQERSVGLLVQSGGTARFEEKLVLGYQHMSRGTYRLTDGILSTPGGTLGWEGPVGSGAMGLFEQSGGTAMFADGLLLGGFGGTGLYALSGGTLWARECSLGVRGRGAFSQSGGQATFADKLTASGIYEMTGGTLTARNATIDSTGSRFTQSGGLAVFQGERLLLGAGGGGTVYVLSGGSLLAQTDMVIDGTTRGLLIQYGGTATCQKDLALGVSVSKRGTYRLTDGALSGVRGTVGYYGRGAFEQSGGTAVFSDSLIVAHESSGQKGTYALSGGSLSTGSGTVGYRGIGVFQQSGGVGTFAGDLVLGYEPGSTGRYDLTGGSLAAGRVTIGYRGIGIFDQSGGTASFADQLILGHETSGTGVYTLSGGSLLAGSGTIGYRGVGEFHQTGGTGTINDSLMLGLESTGTGRYLMEDGVLRVKDYAFIGEGGLGEFIQTGGTVRVGTRVNPGQGAGSYMYLGRQAGAKGSYALQDGLLEVDYALVVGARGTGTLVQTGGTIRMTNSLPQGIVLGYEPGSFGEYLLTDGRAPGVYVGFGGSGHVLQTGGNAGACGVNNGLYELQGGRTGVSTVRGTLIQTGGTNRINSHWGFRLGGSVGARYEMHGGTLFSNKLRIGVAGGAEFVQTGGTCTVMEMSGDPPHGMVLGEAADTSGTYRLTGGSLSVGPPHFDYGYHRTYVGMNGTGLFFQAGGTFCASMLYVGGGSTSSGLYAMSAGELKSYGLEVTEHGEFLQTGGNHSALEGAFVQGRYALTGGQLDANVLTVRNEFSLGRWAELRVRRSITLGGAYAQDPTFHAEALASIHMTGPGGSVRNYSTDPSGLADLGQVWMIFEGSGGELGWFEAAGKDLGPVAEGYQNNFALGVLELAGTGLGRRFLLSDMFDNQPDSPGREALYVDTLILHQGVLLDLGDLSLYYRNHEASVKRFFLADTNLDGAVNGGDAALMGTNWRRADGLADRPDGDLNGDGKVNGGDLALLGGDWGKRSEDWIVPTASPPSGDQGLPEPATLLLLAAGGALLTRRRR